jgi:hypothetical protein
MKIIIHSLASLFLLLNVATCCSIEADSSASHSDVNAAGSLVDNLQSENIQWKYIKKRDEDGHLVEVGHNNGNVYFDIKEIEKDMWVYLEKTFEGRLENHRKYTLQYKLVSDDKLYIQASCEYYTNTPLDEAFYEVTDGGSCYFSSVYDIKRKRFSQLYVHGNA